MSHDGRVGPRLATRQYGIEDLLNDSPPVRASNRIYHVLRSLMEGRLIDAQEHAWSLGVFVHREKFEGKHLVEEFIDGVLDLRKGD